MRRPLRRPLACLLALLVAFPPLTATPALAQIAEEIKLGEEFRDQAIAHMPMIHDYEVVTFIREMGGRIVATLGPQPFTYEWFVVRDPDINAFAVPGGKLFANAGLIFRVENDDALAGVLGHEVAHSAAHHIVRQQQKGALASYGSLLGLLLGILHPGLAVGALAAGQAAQLKYQRDFEREADYLGIEYSRKAGYDPGAMMTLLRTLNADQAINPMRIPPYLLTHPMTSERLTNLEATLGQHEWDKGRVKASYRLRRVQAISRAYSQTREDCVPLYERALAAATPEQRPEALEMIGVLMSHGEEWASADRYLREAEAAGRNVDRELGRTAYRRGNFADARVRLDRVVAKTPDDWDALADLAAIDAEEGKFEDAVAKYRRSIAKEPYRPEVLRALGRSLAKTGKEGEGFYWYGRAGEVSGANAQAAQYYRRAMEKLPPGDPLRAEMTKRSEKLGEKIEEDKARERAEQQQQQQQQRTPGPPVPQQRRLGSPMQG